VLKNNPQVKCNEIKCLFCPEVEGILKQITLDNWVHPICVNWIPEIWFADEKLKDSLAGSIDRSRYGLSCGRCGKKKGALI
jgi:hypothetical protein